MTRKKVAYSTENGNQSISNSIESHMDDKIISITASNSIIASNTSNNNVKVVMPTVEKTIVYGTILELDLRDIFTAPAV